MFTYCVKEVGMQYILGDYTYMDFIEDSIANMGILEIKFN